MKVEANNCPGRRGRLSALSVLLCKSVLYWAIVWARRALNGRKRRFPARAVTGLSLLEFVELRTGVDIISKLPQVLQDIFAGMGWIYIKMLACNSNIEIQYPPSPLCDTCASGGGVVQYKGPQLDLELQDIWWGGERTLSVKLLAGRHLVPEFPYLDVQVSP